MTSENLSGKHDCYVIRFNVAYTASHETPRHCGAVAALCISRTAVPTVPTVPTCTYGTYGTYLRYGTVPYSLDLLYPGITRIVKLKMKLGDF